MKIPFSKPEVGTDEMYMIGQVIKSGHLTTGPLTKEFEEKFAKYVGAKYAIFVNSCTSALKLALTWHRIQIQKRKGLDFVPRVFAPSLTFTATINEIVETGCLPIFCDVDEKTLCMRRDDVRAVEKNDDYIFLPVHLGANESDVVGKRIIYDSAHLIRRGCHRKGSISCYSFYPTKNMTTGEGGMICTDDKKFAEWAVKARHHGRGKAIGSADVEFISSKYNNTDIAAAIGLAQMKRVDWFNGRRDHLVKLYNKLLGKSWTGNHLYLVRVKHRDKFMKLMEKAGIGASIHFHPVHKMTAYKDAFDYVKLPITDKVTKEIVSLPLFPSLTEEQVHFICKKVKQTKLLV